MNPEKLNIALIGFGEAAGAFVSGWNTVTNFSISAFDIKTDSPVTGEADDMWEAYSRAKISGCSTLAESVQDANVVFSLVTADRAFSAAELSAQHLRPKALYLDCNSCAPGTKKRSSHIINARGGRYVDVAVMAPVYPKLHKTPLLISGEFSTEAATVLDCLQMDATKIEGEVGTSSSVKMIRSIMMKGLEALFSECILAGRRAGVDEKVIASLDLTYPGFGFADKSAYMLERMMQHGERRAAEMKEVALTIADLDLPSDMAAATVEWQQRIGELGVSAGENDYAGRADILLTALDKIKRSE
ncbi:DUF1932 domain-containing protein [Sneathiella marina]|uniref:DUF1932 domain-containing protein n=1 Tax=Sneathiella marina TaxID=2950108 RepID=A0ABY4W4W6_9PROT|nr:DUF1932 domain-containing protein [Sneathiella marina]USG62235.1 DUF1932 domain-containing protein [Sneathiella marina]